MIPMELELKRRGVDFLKNGGENSKFGLREGGR